MQLSSSLPPFPPSPPPRPGPSAASRVSLQPLHDSRTKPSTNVFCFFVSCDVYVQRHRLQTLMPPVGRHSLTPPHAQLNAAQHSTAQRSTTAAAQHRVGPKRLIAPHEEDGLLGAEGGDELTQERLWMGSRDSKQQRSAVQYGVRQRAAQQN